MSHPLFARRKYQPLTAHGRKVTGEEPLARCDVKSSRGKQCEKATGHGGYHSTGSGAKWY
jgi:hypothetical protein